VWAEKDSYGAIFFLLSDLERAGREGEQHSEARLDSPSVLCDKQVMRNHASPIFKNCHYVFM
jgi:hypothetical protein